MLIRFINSELKTLGCVSELFHLSLHSSVFPSTCAGFCIAAGLKPVIGRYRSLWIRTSVALVCCRLAASRFPASLRTMELFLTWVWKAESLLMCLDLLLHVSSLSGTLSLSYFCLVSQ